MNIMCLHRPINMLPLQVGTHISTVPTQSRAFSGGALHNSASVTSCYLGRKVTDIENTAMEEKTKIENRGRRNEECLHENRIASLAGV
jgi:hypothetical protein